MQIIVLIVNQTCILFILSSLQRVLMQSILLSTGDNNDDDNLL